MPTPDDNAHGDDPVQVDPEHYHVEFENAQVRVLRVRYGPKEKSVMHRHRAMVTVSLTERNIRFTLPGGRTKNMFGGAGGAVWYEAGEHLPENLSSQPYEGIHIELKDPPNP